MPAGVRSRARERAFTLIELLVAMVLLAIVIAIVVRGLVSAVDGGAGARSGMTSDAAVARAASVLSDDVTQATTADHRDNLVRDPDDLRSALQDHAPAYSSEVTSGSPLVADVDDIVLATPTKLELRADVSPTPGVECVTWTAGMVSTATGPQYQVQRLVGTSCGGSQIDSRVMMRSLEPGGGLVDTSPFEYRLLCRKGTCTGSGGVSGPACEPWVVTGTVPDAKLRWIIGVNASFSTISPERGAARATSSVHALIRGREATSWRRGLGC